MHKNVDQLRIENLSIKREKLWNEHEETWDEDAEKYSMEYPEEIDKLGIEILDMIQKHRWTLPVEFILEELTKLGDAPCLLYDDDGHWAVSGEGFQSINIDDENPGDCHLGHFVTEHMWKNSIREALNHYLKTDE